jgi:hypothetical protein
MRLHLYTSWQQEIVCYIERINSLTEDPFPVSQGGNT